MKSAYVFIASIMLSLFSNPAQAGGHYTCEAKNASDSLPATIYIAMDFKSLNSVPIYEAKAFHHSTPTHSSLDYAHADVFYWTPQESPPSFQVVAILEREDVQNHAFKGKLSITDARAKPYGVIYNLSCSK